MATIATRAEILTYLGKAASLSDADAALLNMLLPLSDAAVKNYLQTSLNYSQHVEFLPIGQPVIERDDIVEPILRDGVVTLTSNVPPGSDAIQLKHTPVYLASLEIREDVGAWAGQAASAFGDGTILVSGRDYYLDVDDAELNLSRSGLIYRFGRWPTEPRSVKVTYYGGLNAEKLNGMWGDVKLAAIIAAAHAFQIAKARMGPDGGGPVNSESIGEYSYSRSAAFVSEASGGGFDLPAGAKQLLFKHRNLGRLFA